MSDFVKPFKVAVVVMLVAIITALHYGTMHGRLELHILHRELYFIPILLACFWFGIKFGLVTSIVVSIIYVPQVYFLNTAHSPALTVGFQILIFNLVAIILGYLVDRQKRQHQEVLGVENMAVLGRAATAVGHEMQDLLAALKRLAGQAKEQKWSELERDFGGEMARLEKMVEILSSFAPKESVQLFSYDLNLIIREKLNEYKKTAKKAGVKLEAKLDENGCPSEVNIEKIGRVMDQILKNALEVTGAGKTIQIRSHRKGSYCTLEIEDEGPGIKPEHLSKMFTPFFTTKKMGHGLALAGCRKVLRDMGCDIHAASERGKGATFTVTIPRESSGKPLMVDPIATVI
jgi:signal transduction histidine kinase